MLVGRSQLEDVIQKLSQQSVLSLDTETSGLHPYKGDRLFSLIIGTEKEVFYFNFQNYANLSPEFVLSKDDLFKFTDIFHDRSKLWFLCNAKFDLHMLVQDGLQISGQIHDIIVGARLEYNCHLSYSLANMAERSGYTKVVAVEEYILKHKLYTWELIPGKKSREKKMQFDKVPLELIQPYAEQDARITFDIGRKQVEAIKEMNLPGAMPTVQDVLDYERKLTPILFTMECRGIRIDTEYCKKAVEYETNRFWQTAIKFKDTTGKPYSASPKLFNEIFQSDRERWELTDKNNPSFDSDTISKFKNPVAKLVLELRDAKSRSDFFNGFLYHVDGKDFLHPNFNQAGTATGRFSSSSPNFQNITNDDGGVSVFPVRRAIIPPEGFILCSMDYQSQEYRLALDYAEEMGLIAKVKEGLDIHEATAQMMGVPRRQAKTLNFMLLYGGGAQKLADALNVTLIQARDLKDTYFSTLPKLRDFIKRVSHTAGTRHWVRTWAGRRLWFRDSSYTYKAPNAIIQGGGADIMKKAMVEIYEFLKPYKSSMILTVHDSIDFENHKSELQIIPKLMLIMENIYPYKHLPLTVSCSWSDSNLNDLEKGLPTEDNVRGTIQEDTGNSVLEAITKDSILYDSATGSVWNPGPNLLC